MKNDIILAGVGGQGILTIAATIGLAALQKNLFIKQSEVHGMSQRGGAVQSHMRISDKPIFSDLIPKGKAGLIISIEPMESLRYLPFISKNGWIITNSKPYKNIPEYPDEDALMEEIRKQHNFVVIDADKIAKDIQSKRSSNIVMLGAATSFIDIPIKNFEKAIEELFLPKGKEIVEKNIEALHKGREMSNLHRSDKT